MKYKVRNKLWIWGGGEKVSWHFVTIPPDVSEKINKKYKDFKKGWGSLPVRATLLNTKPKVFLDTSIFPNTKDKTFLMPVKKKTRLELGVQDGDIVEFTIEIKI
jgi:hypothetical protein